LADKSAQLLLSALGRAAAEPSAVPLHGSKAMPGLFPGTAAARQVAQHCKDEGYLRVVETEARGKVVLEYCTLSDKGLAYLLSQVSPRQVLEDFVRALEARRAGLDEVLAIVRRMQGHLVALKVSAEHVLDHVRRQHLPGTNGTPPLPAADPDSWTSAALAALERWQAAGAPEDCPLPELYRQAAAGVSIGRFHDGLRRLHDQGRIYLHPWTGPLHEVPDPAYALLVGHGIAYYASLR
jgi:hypothetical protein